jgi:hypothetical protein
MKKIASGRVDLGGAHAWFKRARSLPDMAPLDPSLPPQVDTWDFMKALVNLTLPSKSDEMVPHTFLFDEERLIKLRADMEDLINLETCMHLFRGLEVASRTQRPQTLSYDDTPVTSFVSSPFDRPASPANNILHSSPTLPLPHHFAPKAKPILPQGREDRTLSPSGGKVRAVNVENDSVAISSPSSPLSPSSTASTPNTQSPTPLYLSLPFSDSASQVRASLLAILDSSMTSTKWTSLAPSLALQILRSTTTPLALLPQFESHLEFHLSKPCSKVYQESERRVLSQLLPILQQLVETYTPLTCLQIFETATPQKTAPGISNTQTDSPKDAIAEIATRIAHIGILHWRVWAPFAYLINPDGEEEERTGEQQKGKP